MKLALTGLLSLLACVVSALAAVLFQERGTLGIVFVIALALIAGWTLGAALEGIWRDAPAEAPGARAAASRGPWERVRMRVSSRDIAVLWLGWITVAFVVVVGGWLGER